MTLNGEALAASQENALEAELFLQENYLFRRNVLNGKVEFATLPAEEPHYRALTQEALNSAQILQMIQSEYPSVKSNRSTQIHLGLAMKELGIDHLLYNNKRLYKIVPLISA